MRNISYLWRALAAIVLLVTTYSCERDDSEPKLDVKKFSRLYVSFEEYGTSNAGIPDTNVRIIFPADSSGFKFSLKHVSEAKGGGVLYYNPYLQSVFQAPNPPSGVPDTAVYSLSVGEKTGLLENRGRMKNRLFNNVKGFAYHPYSETFFMVSASGDDAGVYLQYRPRGKTGYVKPFKKLRATNLDMWGAAFENYNLFVTKRGSAEEDGGIYVFEKIMDTKVNPADSVGNLVPTRTLTIADAKNLRGFSYDTVKNVLAISDFVTNGAVGTGRILIFDNFNSLINQTSIVPTRIITGPATLLKEPVDVAIDTRTTGQYLYVVDRSKKVLRFKISDNGNVAPDKMIDTDKIGTPVGLALDSRDASTLGQ